MIWYLGCFDTISDEFYQIVSLLYAYIDKLCACDFVLIYDENLSNKIYWM